MGNTELTKACVVSAAYRLACQIGLLQISVRTVAAAAGFSKTGTITHFKNLETLQIAILDHAGLLFLQEVFQPAAAFARGLPRLREIFRLWVNKNNSNETCLIISGAFEVDSQPGPLRSHIHNLMCQLREQVRLAVQEAIEEGHLVQETSSEEFSFAMFSLAMGTHHDSHLLNRNNSGGLALKLFENLLGFYSRQESLLAESSLLY